MFLSFPNTKKPFSSNFAQRGVKDVKEKRGKIHRQCICFVCFKDITLRFNEHGHGFSKMFWNGNNITEVI